MPWPPVPWSLWDAAVVFVLVFLVASLLGFVLGATLPEDTAEAAFFPASTALTGAVALFYVAARYGGAGARRLFGPNAFRSVDLVAGALHGVVAFLLINVGFALLLDAVIRLVGGDLPTVQEGLRELALDEDRAVLFFLSAVVIAPLAEELFFRGMLFQRLRDRLSFWPAAGFSALLFAALHFDGNPEASLYAFLVLLPVGMYFAWVFNRRGNLVTAFMMHAVFNGLGVVGISAGLA